jgi:hypothetical protein
MQTLIILNCGWQERKQEFTFPQSWISALKMNTKDDKQQWELGMGPEL